MAAIDSATGVNSSVVVVGQNLNDAVSASSSAIAAASSVDGIATGNAVSTQDVGVLDSTLSVGGNGGLSVNETGVVSGSATTVNALNIIATGSTSGSVGDRVVSPTTGLTLGFITNAATGAYTAHPDGTGAAGV